MTCSACEKNNRVVAKGLCSACYNATRMRSCSECGENRVIATSLASKDHLCYRCYARRRVLTCSACGRRRPIHRRAADGGSVCGACYSATLVGECVICGEAKRVNARTPNGHPVCCACYVMVDVRQFFRTYQTSAQRRNLSFDLSNQDFEQVVKQPCMYCGGFNRGGIFSGLDRVDNKIGYIKENVVPCCGECNMMRGMMFQQEFLDRIVRIARYMERMP